MSKRISELEEVVVDAWPAEECEVLDGWLLRKSGGPTHRGNSVATLDAGRELELRERIERAEAFYRARGTRPMFQVGPCATPSGLDAALAERGYAVEGAAVCAIAEVRDVLDRLPRGTETSVSGRASEAWLELARTQSRFRDTYDVFLGFLKRLGTRCRYATARDAKGTVVAGCFAISSEERLGIYGMLTIAEARRRGAGGALLRALAESAAAECMRELYLLVETDNVAARALYQKAGFTDAYTYHYRVHGEPSVPVR